MSVSNKPSQKIKTKSSEIKLPTLEELLEAGVHFGHQTRRWHPKMAPYIFMAKKGIHIFDLTKTLERLRDTVENLQRIASEGGVIIFVGTKRQARSIVEESANKCGAMFVTKRWLGGTITNFESVKVNLNKLKDLKAGLASGKFNDRPKKERLLLEREARRLERLVGGIVDLERLPDAVFVIDTKREKTVVREARKKGVPIAAIVDSNCDPTFIDYVIPGNDDASRSIKIILDVIVEAIRKGYEKAGREIEIKGEIPPEVSEASKKVVRQEVQEAKEVSEIADMELSTRSTNALVAAGITSKQKLKGLSEDALSNIKGLGKKSVKEILDKMKKE